MPIVPLPSTVADFRDALGLALELSDEFAFAHAAVVTDEHSHCIDFAVFTDIGDGMARALHWLSGRGRWHPPRSRVLLISIRSVDGLVVAERDLHEFREAQRLLGRLGVALLDWIETDGELVRSYRYLVNPSSRWSRQAVAEGAIDVDEY